MVFRSRTTRSGAGAVRRRRAEAVPAAALEQRVMLDGEGFELQILHASDFEGGLDALERAANFGAIVDTLEDEVANSVLISAGDNYIPGPVFSAAGDRSLRDVLQGTYQELFGESGLTNVREDAGRVDISILNILGVDAAAVGNHEFDAGPNAFAGLIGTDIRGGDLDDIRWLGAQFPYLSANLDFSADGDLAPLFTDEILADTEFAADPADLNAAGDLPKLAPATVIERGGELIGVVGATTQVLESITSTGGVEVIGPDANDMAALAAILQPVIDDVIDGEDDLLGTADDVNKVILTSHLQQIALEKELIGLLSGVDVVIAGGSDTLQADATDRLRAGDVADEDYPFVTTNADGDAAAVVSTAGEYGYVGRLVVEFDADGVLLVDSLDPAVNGAYVTDDQGVLDVTGAATIEEALAGSVKATEIGKLTDAVEAIVVERDGNVFGQTDVFLDGRRSEVRTEETNLGSLTADANLFAARQFDDTVQVSLKNGGGIRASIGAIDGLTGEELPPQADPASGKLEGEISQLDIENALRFNNGLTLLTVTVGELKLLLEHAVAATADGATPGQFAQVGGMKFSFDPDGEAASFSESPTGELIIDNAGTRIRSLALIDDAGAVTQVLVEDGVIVADADQQIRMVTLDFLFGAFSSSPVIGGDGYPLPAFGTDIVQLREQAPVEGEADFAAFGSEQDAFAEFLAANFPVGGPGFDDAETGPGEDARIQNLAVAADSILETVFEVDLTNGNDRVTLIRDGGFVLLRDARGRELFRERESDVDVLTVNGRRGNDVLVIDEAGGDFDFAGGFEFDGGRGFDRVTVFADPEDEAGFDGGDLVTAGTTYATSGVEFGILFELRRFFGRRVPFLADLFTDFGRRSRR